VAISLFVRRPNSEKGVWRSDLWGKRLTKYQIAALATESSINWTRLQPGSPNWLFTLQDIDLGRCYREFWSVPAIFSRSGDPAPGIVTTHDKFAVSFTPDEAHKKIGQLLATNTEAEARRLWKLCSQDQWSYQRAKEDLPKVNLPKATVSILYQPFVKRWTIWDRNVAVHRRERITQHMLGANIALNVIRKMDISGTWSHVLVSDRPISHHACPIKK
jgi:hypothetical protein